VGGAVAHATMNVMGARLGNTRSSHIVVVLIYSILHLLQELINIDQIVLGPHVTHGRQVVGRCGGSTPGAVSATTNGHWRRHRLVLRQGPAAQHRERQALQAQQTLTDSSIGVRVELTPFQVAKELIQGIVAALLGFIRSMGSLWAVVQGVVDISVGRVGRLRRRVRLVILGSAMCIALAGDRVQRGLKIVRSGRIAYISCQPAVQNSQTGKRLPLAPPPNIMSGFRAPGSGDRTRTESSAWVLTCFFKSWGRLKAFPQKSHLCGLSGTCTRM
jgi:hypothetical protein